MSSRAVVTGTSGFIGHHLAAALVERGFEVRGIDVRPPPRPLPGVDYLRQDILDRAGLIAALRDFRPEEVFHLAARTDLDETVGIEGYAANTRGVENLIEAIRETPSVRRSICTSSQLVCRVGYRPAGPQDYAPNTTYGESKVQTERIWRDGDGGGREWMIVRPTTVWGPGMNPHYLTFFRLLRDGRYFHVGSRPVMKSYGYVGNVVAQYLCLMRAPVSQVHAQTFYLSDYSAIGLSDWAEAFRLELGAPRIRTMPLAVARAGALVGDAINRAGIKRFPLNSFRLGNILTPSEVEMEPTRAVCGEMPFSLQQGVAATAIWLRELWATPAS